MTQKRVRPPITKLKFGVDLPGYYLALANIRVAEIGR
jgi:hypothetical protein